MMKNVKINKLGAIAMLLALSACQREDVNPNFNPETNTVLTQFVFNLNTNSYQTKQSAAETQAVISSESPFRGIKESFLMSVIQPDGMRGKVLPADMNAEEIYPMEDILSSGAITNTNSRRVLEMSLPLKTNTMLFYGRAIKPATTVTDEYSADDRYGKLDNYEITKSANSANFRLGIRLQESDYANIAAVEKLLSGILTVTMNYKLEPTVISAGGKPDGVTNPYDYDIATTEYTGTTGGTIKWSDYATAATSPFDGGTKSELEKKLGNIYSQVTTIRTAEGELRAASGFAILRMVQDIWSIINSVRCADPTSKREAVAKYFAEQVDILLQGYFAYSTHDGAGGPVTVSGFKANSAIKTAFESDAAAYWPSSDTDNDAVKYKPTSTELGIIVTKAYNLSKFPEIFNLPRGATHMDFDVTNKYFNYPTAFNTSGMGGAPTSGSTYNEKSYYYPAELLYFGNSPIRVSNNARTADKYPNGANTNAAVAATETTPANPGGWNLDANWASTDWTGNYVTSSTRSVAMQYDINYGVALLKTQVKYASGLTQLEDNNHFVQYQLDHTLTATDEPNNKISITGDLFDLVGVIIGGQHQNVDWQYLPCKDPKTTSSTYNKDVTGFVYDKAIPAAAKDIPASGTSQPNYTLLFDNYDATKTDTAQDKVYIALEFQNNGPDFYGNYNIIRNGGYFYLIGELDPYKEGLAAITWPGNSSGVSEALIPPYYTADEGTHHKGDSKEIKRVFIQDFVTDVTFTLGQYSLQYAYLTVPDLRSSSVTLGLSVDVKWETGLVFSDVILGGSTDKGLTTTP